MASCSDGPASRGDEMRSFLIPMTMVRFSECGDEKESYKSGCEEQEDLKRTSKRPSRCDIRIEKREVETLEPKISFEQSGKIPYL